MIHNTDAVRAIIQAAPIGGITSAEIEDATGLTVMKVQHALMKLLQQKRIVGERLGISRRFFADEAAREAGKPVLDEIRAVAKAEKDKRCAIYQKEYQEKHRARKHALDLARYRAKQALRKALPPRPKKAPKPITLLQPKPVNREKAARQAWAAQEAIRPDGVKITQCPGYTGESRFAPAPDAVGMGLRAEWERLRA